MFSLVGAILTDFLKLAGLFFVASWLFSVELSMGLLVSVFVTVELGAILWMVAATAFAGRSHSRRDTRLPSPNGIPPWAAGGMR